MPSVNNSANMNLPVPVVGVEAGPMWATDINSCMTIIDSHNHAPGSGVPVGSAGISIDADLGINQFNLTNIRSSRYMVNNSALALATDLGCVYVAGVDLYFNDVNGNQIQITQGGGVAGSPGSISNLTSPASASYVSIDATFVWQSDVNTPANLDAGSIILRNVTAGSNGITLSPPGALGSNYTITLPTLPGSSGFITIDSSGNMSSAVTVDNSTIELDTNQITIKDHGVTKIKQELMSVSATAAPAGGLLRCTAGSSTNTSTTFATVTDQTGTLETTGRPVFVGLQAGPSTLGQLTISSTNGDPNGYVRILRDGSEIVRFSLTANAATSGGTTSMRVPASSISFVDVVAAGTYTYAMQIALINSAAGTVFISAANVSMIAYEI